MLIFAQTVFYLTFSLAIWVFGALFCVLVYYFISIAKHLNKLSEDLDEASDDVRESIKEIIDKLSALPFLSYFFQKENKKTKNYHKKN